MSEPESDDDASGTSESDLELLFLQAFAEADPAPYLLKLVKEHPNYENIEFPLIDFYVEAVEKNPSRGQVLASALAKLDTLSDDINSRLTWEVHFRIDFDKEAKEYGPKNKFLLHSLLSGLSLKHRLTSNSTMFSAIEKGLELDDYRPRWLFNSLDPEVLVVGACIQLLLIGSMIPTERTGPGYRRSAEVVAKNLNDRKAAGIVKDPHAIQVLELAILHAESGLKPENDRDDVWDLLFPSKSY